MKENRFQVGPGDLDRADVDPCGAESFDDGRELAGGVLSQDDDGVLFDRGLADPVEDADLVGSAVEITGGSDAELLPLTCAGDQLLGRPFGDHLPGVDDADPVAESLSLL